MKSKSLLLIQDPLLRDQVQAGLEQCPGSAVECPEGPSQFELARSEEWDWIWLELGAEKSGSLLKEVRERNSRAQLIALGEPDAGKKLGPWKEQWKVTAFLPLPLDAESFFRTLERLRSRHNP